MTERDSQMQCRLIKSKESSTSFSCDALPFFEEGMKPFCKEYFESEGLSQEDVSKKAEEAFEQLALTYLSLRKKGIDDYIAEHQQEHDDALNDEFYSKQKDPELAYRLSLLCADYTLYTRKEDKALIVDLHANVPLPYIEEEAKPIVVEKTIEKVIEKPVEAQPVAEEKEDEEEKEEETEPTNDPFPNIKRRTFTEKLKKSSPELKANYKAIKQAAIDCKLKGRVSKACDTYHLGRKTYLKIAISGKTLKCYFAVKAEDYSNTSIPLEVSDKKAYQDTPTLLRVRSSLAVRRAISIIGDMTAEKEEAK